MRVAWLKDLRLKDLAEVGGKNASLGEMIGALAAAGIRVPGGFATTAAAFHEFLDSTGLKQRIAERLAALDSADVKALAAAGKEIRSWILDTPFPAPLAQEIREHYQQLERQAGGGGGGAVRGALFGHRRRPARSLLRRPAGKLPQHQRRRQRARGDSPRVR